MNAHQSWLEAPYQAAAARDEAIEKIEEDLWNDTGSPVSEALEVLMAEVPLGAMQETIIQLVSEWAEHTFDSQETE